MTQSEDFAGAIASCSPPTAAPYPRLVGDVGGTHARFGWVPGPDAGVCDVQAFATRDHAGLEAVVSRYLEAHRRPSPASCAIGIATPVTGDAIAMTNLNWSFSIAGLRRHIGVDRLLILNDYEALAMALPTLAERELRPIGTGSAVPVVGAPKALLGAGTGLGVSGLVAVAGRFVPIVGEGGHISLAPVDAREDRLLTLLRERFGRVSAERVLSGPGLENLYVAHCAIHGRTAESLEAREITARAQQGRDADCHETVERFFAFLGSFAGDLALTLGARGGVYIGGGIVPQLGDWIERSRFRERFEAKGRYRSYLAAIPTWLITDSSAAALQGANRALDA
ncbi:MAG: glucokinase [Caldimonas sp.]